MATKSMAMVILLLATVTVASAIVELRKSSVKGWKELSIDHLVDSTTIKLDDGTKCGLHAYYDNETLTSAGEREACLTDLVEAIIIEASLPLGVDGRPNVYYASRADADCTIICEIDDFASPTATGSAKATKSVSFFSTVGLAILSIIVAASNF